MKSNPKKILMICFVSIALFRVSANVSEANDSVNIVPRYDWGNISLTLQDGCSKDSILSSVLITIIDQATNSSPPDYYMEQINQSSYIIYSLFSGTYTVTCFADGYEKLTVKDVLVYPMNTTTPLGTRELIPSPKIFYRDVDGDGYGNPNDAIQTSCLPVGYVSVAGDCNDSDYTVHPGASEICDRKDNNCDGRIDEGFPAVYQGSMINQCSRGIVLEGMVTVVGNGETNTIYTVGGYYSVPLMQKTHYVVTFMAAGYETRVVDIPDGTVNFCGTFSGVDIDMTPTVNLSDAISILRIMSGINAAPPIWLNNHKVEMWHEIYALQRISKLR